MDWKLCLICQKSTTEHLRCPLKGKRSGDKSQPYSCFLNNVNAFRDLDALPIKLNFGIEVTVDELVQNCAVWHKSCHVKFCREKLDRACKKRESDSSAENSNHEKKRPRRQSMDKMACLFCQHEDGNLHEFRTFKADETVRQMAKVLQETELMTRLEGGDLIALEAKYHLECLTGLRNRYRSLLRQRETDSGESSETAMIKARGLVELFSYIENCIEEGTFYFKFSVLHELYQNRLRDLGVDNEINRTRFKEKIMTHFPEAQEQSDGKYKILVFEQGIHQMIKQAMASDYEGDALILAKAAKIVRQEILNFKGFHRNQQEAPSPDGWGWTLGDCRSWVPVWNSLPMASKACSELIKCGCKSQSGCGTRCACRKAHWKCTKLYL